MSGDMMSGDKMPQESVPDQYEYKDSSAGAPSGHGAAAPPPSAGAAAAPARTGATGAPPPGYVAPPGHAPPQHHYVQPQYAQQQYAPPQHHYVQPQYAQQQYAPPQHHYVQPQYAQQQYAPPPPSQPHYAPAGSFNAYPQEQQMHPANVVYRMSPAPAAAASYGHQQSVYHQAEGAPPPQMMMMQPMGQWTTGLFDCGEDPKNSVMTCLLPCVTFGEVAEVVTQGTMPCVPAAMLCATVICCFLPPCCVSCMLRTKLRAKYNLPRSKYNFPQEEISDFCVHFWCEPCALCQEYRELANRGLDPSRRWEQHRQRMFAQSTQMPMGAPQPVCMCQR